MKITSLIKRTGPKKSIYIFLALTLLVGTSLYFFSGHSQAQTDTFSTPGTTSWTVPSGASSAVFEAWGAGGAGGGATGNNSGGGGGAGGQYAITTLNGLQTGDSYTVTVASATTGTTGNGSTGGDSGVTSPSSAQVVLAKGGTGGTTGGIGALGSSTGGVGDTVYAGGSGINTLNAFYSGAGGGGAGSSGPGADATSNGTVSTGGTGSSSNGGNGGDGILAVKSAGNNGNNYGGAGSGGYKTNGGSQSGGSGAQGLVTITYTINAAAGFPSIISPASGSTGVSVRPTFSFSDTDSENDDIQFKVVIYQSDCSTVVATYDMASGQTGWSPSFDGTAGSGLTYKSATYNGGISFTPTSSLSYSTTYCWTAFANEPAGNANSIGSTQSFTTGANSSPNIPSLSTPSSGATNQSRFPTFSFSDTDNDNDDIQFTLNLFQSDCSTPVSGYPLGMSAGQTGWSPSFDGIAGSGKTYTSSTSGSGITYTPNTALSYSTTYCWSVSAVDPSGSNSTASSSTRSFTTAAQAYDSAIQGGVIIRGGSVIQ